MGNPQGTLTKEDLAWLGGILDGEGSFLLNKRDRHGKNPGYAPRISVSNTSHMMMEEIARIGTEAGFGTWITKVQGPSSPLSKRAIWQLHIAGTKRCLNALNVLLPYVRAKWDQASLLRDFCLHRLEQGHYQDYGPFDDWCFERMREFRNSSETRSTASEIYQTKG